MIVAMSKQWEFFMHKDCLEWSLKNSDEFKEEDNELLEKNVEEVGDRVCVLCGVEMRYRPPQTPQDFQRCIVQRKKRTKNAYSCK
jgi:hypothetical protein